jgi:hypothetical protein
MASKDRELIPLRLNKRFCSNQDKVIIASAALMEANALLHYCSIQYPFPHKTIIIYLIGYSSFYEQEIHE